MKSTLKKILTSFLLSIHYFNKNNLILNAGALTFYFIISLVPVFLLILTISNIIAISNAEVIFNILNSMKNLNEEAVSFFYKIISNSKSINIFSFGISGIISILLTSLLFSKSLNISFVNIMDIKQKKLVGILLPFLLNISGLIILLTALLLKVGLLFVHKLLFKYVNIDLSYIVTILSNLLLAPKLLVFLIIFLSYYFLSGRKFSFKTSFFMALLFSFSIYLLNRLYFVFISINYYKAVYGQIGLVIFSLYWLYFIFILYLFFAQFGACLTDFKIYTTKFWIQKGRKLNKLYNKIFPENLDKNFLSIEEREDILKLKNSNLLIVEGYIKIKNNGKTILKQAGDLVKIDDDNIDKIADIANLQVISLKD
ncbi:YihY/virulence factor BrkB family protein [Deferribacterales bacterium Es71-Z0220]|uniref:YihY/virulence factor BrkB family protein n=1 Tax=Deferrivibrio essentukiensis TaxID=2880922 RepID=UPI001F60305B|nr:YhjD/YihY/BrkB family envelope integrity protein [Deferrivibrio essentukiensis]MCB4205153.1 YihY/virulence factor BrkB family protein [Deferrivibrio essentukiensis]